MVSVKVSLEINISWQKTLHVAVNELLLRKPYRNTVLERARYNDRDLGRTTVRAAVTDNYSTFRTGSTAPRYCVVYRALFWFCLLFPDPVEQEHERFETLELLFPLSVFLRGVFSSVRCALIILGDEA